MELLFTLDTKDKLELKVLSGDLVFDVSDVRAVVWPFEALCPKGTPARTNLQVG